MTWSTMTGTGIHSSRPSMAFLVFQPTATGAGIVPSWLEDDLGNLAVLGVFHNASWSPAQAEFMSHEPHRPVNMPEELLVAGAQIV